MIKDVVGGEKKPELEENGYYARLLSKVVKGIKK